jgi:hypothetical protein
MPKKKKQQQKLGLLDSLTNKATAWIGSTSSIIFHTIFFMVIFILVLFGITLDTVLLILTTVVSLEAIYLAIFIQRSVTQQQVVIASEFDELEEAISEDIDETEKALRLDLDDTEAEISKDIDETEKALRDDLDDTEAEISKDIDETEKGIVKKTPQALEKPLDEVIVELRQVIREEIEQALKKK